MTPIEKRLRASVGMGAHDGDSGERSVCGKQMLEAATTIEQLQRERDELRVLLRSVVDAWVYEASQGDGIMEQHDHILTKAQIMLKRGQDE